MKTDTYTGWLREGEWGEVDDILFLSGIDVPLAAELEWMGGRQCTVRYWLCEKECTKDEAQEDFLQHLMGLADTKFGAHYSDVTGYLWTDEKVKVGGHDLIAELSSHAERKDWGGNLIPGRWLILEIDTDEGRPDDWAPDGW